MRRRLGGALALLPANLIPFELRGRDAIPRFLGDADRPWLRQLLDVGEQCAGRTMRELGERLREPIPGAPEDKRRLAAHLLLARARSRVQAALPPREARALVFSAAAVLPRRSPAEVLAACASEVGLLPEVFRSALLADLPGERLATAPGISDPGELALRANLLLAQGLVARAARVLLDIEGNTRAVARHASLHGLLCTIMPGASTDSARLELSGPFALFRRTLLYGRALCSILPVLAWTRRFRLEAACDLRGRRLTVTLATGDPLFPSSEPRRFDSQVEERFARDLTKAAPGWVLVREPAPFQADGHLVFPDFALHRLGEPERRWYVEIVGFWTPEYLAKKLERLRKAGIARLVLCIDEARNVGVGSLPDAARVVRYRRRVDPRAVLLAIEEANP